ncbi:MAG: hypothetical protein PHO33_00915 [Clostridia bacterium]|nr:hypothetical protein [Clostridia bacterium]
MEKAKFYLQKLVCACILLLVCILFTGCPAYEVASLSVDTLTIPQNIAYEDLILEDVEFTVTYKDGEVITEFVSAYMLSDEDITKLSTAGTHIITINYMQATTTFEITLIEKIYANMETIIIDSQTSSEFTDLDYTVDTSDHDPAYIYFEDAELVDALNFEDYGITSQVAGDYAYTLEDLQKYTNYSLMHFNGTIKNLSGLEYLPVIRYIYLNNNDICDITPLNQLTNLDTIFIQGNHIKSLEALTNLTKLTYLDISNNEINVSAYSRTIDLNEMQYLEQIKANNPGLLRQDGKYNIFYFTQQMYFDASRITENTPTWELLVVSVLNIDYTVTNADETQTRYQYSADETDLELMKETLRTFEIMAEIASNYQINIVITNVIYKDTITDMYKYFSSEEYKINIDDIPNLNVNFDDYDSYAVLGFHGDIPFQVAGTCRAGVIKTEIYIPFAKGYDSYNKQKATMLKLAKDNKITVTECVLSHEFVHAVEQYWLTRKIQTGDESIVVPEWHYVEHYSGYQDVTLGDIITVDPYTVMKYFSATFLDPDTQEYQGVTVAMWQETPLDYLSHLPNE